MAKKIILFRKESQEEARVPLWFEDKNRDFIVSMVGSQGDTRMKISTPEKHHSVGFPGADFGNIKRNKEEYKKAAKKYLKIMGYDSELRG